MIYVYMITQEEVRYMIYLITYEEVRYLIYVYMITYEEVQTTSNCWQLTLILAAMFDTHAKAVKEVVDPRGG